MTSRIFSQDTHLLYEVQQIKALYYTEQILWKTQDSEFYE